jgi:hypothetical protein
MLVINLSPAGLRAEDASAGVCGQTHFENALILALDANYANLSIRDCVPETAGGPAVCKKCQPINIRVDNLTLRNDLKPFRVGDHVRLDIMSNKDSGDGQGTMVLKEFRGAWTIDTSRTSRGLVLAICLTFFFLLAAVAARGNPFIFVVGMDNRYSNSKVQLALWFWIVISTYVAAMVFRVYYAGWDFLGIINVPQNLLVLSGLSAITYGGAKAITTAKANNADPAAQAAGDARAKAAGDAQAKLNAAQAALKANPTDPALMTAVTNAQGAVDALPKAVPDVKTVAPESDKNFLNNLLQNDVGRFDFGDFQMLVVTLLAAATYLLLFVKFFGSIAFTKAITLPDVDTTVLSIFGLGQGAYLAKKAGGNAGTT